MPYTTMIVPLSPFQWFRIALKRSSFAPNHAPTLAGILSGRCDYPSAYELTRAFAAPQRRAGAWASVQGGETIAVASAGRMNGPRSWQVTQLLLTGRREPDAGPSQDALAELLAHVADQATRARAERVFLRTPPDSPLGGAAQRSGFFPAHRETLMERSQAAVAANPVNLPEPMLRQSAPQDEYGLFRLYGAAVPAEVRRVAGMTFDQWRDSRERAPGRSRQYVLDGERGPLGCLNVGRAGRVGHMQAMAAPQAGESAATLTAHALNLLADAPSALSLAPSYQPALLAALRDNGFIPRGEFVVSVRRLALTVPMRSPAGAPAG